MAKDTHELGSNIALVGFSEIDPATMDVVKKLVSHFTQKFVSHNNEMQSLRITLKELHKREKGEIYEVHAHLKQEQDTFSAETTDRNLFVAVDLALKKVKREIEHAEAKARK